MTAKEENRSDTTSSIRRRPRREVNVLIDGTSLDRACRRIKRRIDLAKLLQVASSNQTPKLARYYTLVPHEDDARQHSFLGAVTSAGLETVVKRLPPKGVNRQVSLDGEMSADIVALALRGELNLRNSLNGNLESENNKKHSEQGRRVIVLVCPSRELLYPLSMIRGIGVDTICADFGKAPSSEMLSTCSDYIDLSSFEQIWL